MTKPRGMKLLFCLAWTILVFVSLSVDRYQFGVSGQTTPKANTPSLNLIDTFDEAIQQRFITEPDFGIRRVQPTYPTNPHISEYFNPKDGVESESVEKFLNEDFKVSLYLFGRRITKEVDEKSDEMKFTINYRLHNPMAVTKNVKPQTLSSPRKLLKEIKAAFQELQTKDSFEFNNGNWSYIARPVRAQESCVKCHTDYVIAEKTGKSDYKFRKRRAGDANGILVYGFLKDK